MSWLSKLNPRGGGQRAPPSASLQPPPPADPETCLMVFKNHWAQVLRILERRGGPPAPDDLSAVRNNTLQMLQLLAEERPRAGGAGGGDSGGPILQFVAAEGVLERVLGGWGALGAEGGAVGEQLELFEALLSQAQQPLLCHPAVLRPLRRLLRRCAPPAPPLHPHLVPLLNQLCLGLAKEPAALQLFFHGAPPAPQGSPQGSPPDLLLFSLLIPFVHQEGLGGQQARDALLLLMATAAPHPQLATAITQHSHFCPVLATGLSALYSSLPRRLEVRGDDWHCLRREDWLAVPSLALFMSSLEFCNAVIQVAHPLVQQQLVDYVHNGFLVPVMGPALHKSSVEEMVASTAYLELFLRSVTEPPLLKAFLRFLLLHRHDGATILHTLLGRLATSSRLCMVSLSLFRTLLSLNCEDVMLQLVLRYLLPCRHVMLSQRRAVRDVDIYGRAAAKFLSLIPRCCRPPSPPAAPQHPDPSAKGTLWGSPRPACELNRPHRVSPTGDLSPPQPLYPPPPVPLCAPLSMTPMTPYPPMPGPRVRCGGPQSAGGCPLPCPGTEPPHVSPAGDPSSLPKPSTPSRLSFFTRQQSAAPDAGGVPRSPGPSGGSPGPPRHGAPPWEEVWELEGNYLEYLRDARRSIERCAWACRVWSAPYDGQEPPADGPPEPPEHPPEHTGPRGPPDPPGPTEPLCPSRSPAAPGPPEPTGPLGPPEPTGPLCPSGPPAPPHPLGPPGPLCSMAPPGPPSPRTKKRGLPEEGVQEGAQGGSPGSRGDPSTGGCSPQPPAVNGGVQGGPGGAVAVKKVRRSPQGDNDTDGDNVGTPPERGGCVAQNGGSPRGQPPTPEPLPWVDSLLEELLARAPPEPPEPPGTIEAFTAELRHIEAQMEQGGGALPAPAEPPEPPQEEEEEEEEEAWDGVGRGAPDPLAQLVASPPRGGALPPAQPFTGPFVSALFGRLENMVQNSLYVNVLLTGVLAQLAAYPQPLLRSFLLNTNMVFQPSVKSLLQVLGSVKSQIERFAAGCSDFPALLFKAKKFLIARGRRGWAETPGNGAGNGGPPLRRPDSLVRSRKPSLGELLLRHTQSPTRGRPATPLPLRDGLGGAGLAGAPPSRERQSEALRVRNGVYCAVIFSEFLKELAAIAQAHAVTSPFLTEPPEE
ncbi:FHF complex subunit HOOK-interacting protein 1B [Podargus strigoides]